MKMLKTLAAALLIGAPATSFASTVPVYETGGSILVVDLNVGGILGDFFDDSADDLDISVNGSLENGVVSANLLVSSVSTAEVFLQSSSVLSNSIDLIDPGIAGPTEDSATFVFGDLTGSETDLFNGTATVLFTFFAEEADTGFIATANAQILSDVAPIPLPASLPLLGGAIFGAMALRRKRQ